MIEERCESFDESSENCRACQVAERLYKMMVLTKSRYGLLGWPIVSQFVDEHLASASTEFLLKVCEKIDVLVEHEMFTEEHRN